MKSSLLAMLTREFCDWKTLKGKNGCAVEFLSNEKPSHTAIRGLQAGSWSLSGFGVHFVKRDQQILSFRVLFRGSPGNTLASVDLQPHRLRRVIRIRRSSL